MSKGKKTLPSKLFSYKFSRWSLVKFPILFGMLPLNLLALNDKFWRLLHSFILEGSWPENLFKSKWSTSRLGRWWHISSGKLPDRLLFLRLIYFKEEMLKIETGISPFKRICDASNISNERRFPISHGISPTN